MRYPMLLFVALPGAVCCSPAEPDPEPEPYTRSPEELVNQITASYNYENIEDCTDCLTGDFRFRLHPDVYPDSTWSGIKLAFSE